MFFTPPFHFLLSWRWDFSTASLSVVPDASFLIFCKVHCIPSRFVLYCDLHWSHPPYDLFCEICLMLAFLSTQSAKKIDSLSPSDNLSNAESFLISEPLNSLSPLNLWYSPWRVSPRHSAIKLLDRWLEVIFSSNNSSFNFITPLNCSRFCLPWFYYTRCRRICQLIFTQKNIQNFVAVFAYIDKDFLQM